MIEITAAEMAEIERRGRCRSCGHLNALHDDEVGYCNVEGCTVCVPRPSGKSLLELQRELNDARERRLEVVVEAGTLLDPSLTHAKVDAAGGSQRGALIVHKGCGGRVEWVDTSPIDEDHVCQACGQVVDGEDMEAVGPLRIKTEPLSGSQRDNLSAGATVSLGELQPDSNLYRVVAVGDDWIDVAPR